MSDISTKSNMSLLFTYKGLIKGTSGKESKPAYPFSTLREKLNSKRKRLKDLQKMHSIPADSLRQMALEQADKDYVITKCKAIVSGIY